MTQIEIQPLVNHVGAAVKGLDAALQLSDDDRATLAAGFRRYGLLVSRGLEIDIDQQLTLARIFGEPVLREKNQVANPSRRTQHVSNVMEDGVFGAGELDFHMDQLFWPEPLKALMLYGIEIPSRGGDTKFVDTSLVYERMPDKLRTAIDGLRCQHAYTFAGDLAKDWRVKDAETQDMAVEHPIVWRDPGGERVGIWVNKLTTVGVVGLPKEESAALINAVRERLYDETATYTHKWQPGDLVLWNNHTFQHARMPFDASERRTLRRTTLM